MELAGEGEAVLPRLGRRDARIVGLSGFVRLRQLTSCPAHFRIGVNVTRSHNSAFGSLTPSSSPPARRREVARQRDARLKDQAVAAGAGRLHVCVLRFALLERRDGDQRERGERDQPGGQHAPRRVARGVAHPEARDRSTGRSTQSSR